MQAFGCREKRYAIQLNGKATMPFSNMLATGSPHADRDMCGRKAAEQSLFPFFRQDFMQLVRSHRRLPMSVQTAENVEVEMDGLKTLVQLVVFSADVSQGTVGVKFL